MSGREPVRKREKVSTRDLKPETLRSVTDSTPQTQVRLSTSPHNASKPIDLQIWYFYPLVQIGRIDGQTPILPVSVKVNP
jgi:hypothetical protein